MTTRRDQSRDGGGHQQQRAQRGPRTSKACEPCRLRRIKCVGSPPCEQCTVAGVGGQCIVRVKARPRRAPSSVLVRLQQEAQQRPAEPSPRSTAAGADAASPTMALSFSTPAVSVESEGLSGNFNIQNAVNQTSPLQEQHGSSDYGNENPLAILKSELEAWCNDKGLPISSLEFTVKTRLTDLVTAPLLPEPQRSEREDQLMARLFEASWESVRGERALLLSLYGRYRTLPSSLTDDQKALVYAALCVTRYLCPMENHAMHYQPMHFSTDAIAATNNSIAREDTAYYQMAVKALESWKHPSLTAIWALFYLVPYASAVGGADETRDLLRQWAWHVTELGLHRSETAALYQPQDHVGALFAAYFYRDVFQAHLTDLNTCISLTAFDVDPTPPEGMFADPLNQCTLFTAKLLADFADKSVNTSSEQYIAAAEAAWAPALRQLRLASGDTDIPKSKLAWLSWAQLRYNWLRCLLYIPQLRRPGSAPNAYAIIGRSVEQILVTYQDLADVDQLNPTWPQLQRLVFAGQLLILCYEAGEFHKREGQALCQLLVDLLVKHKSTWPIAADLIAGFSAAAKMFNIVVSPNLAELDDPQTLASADDLATWQFCHDIGFDFDLSSFSVI